jgi:hypothetical protein
VARLGESRNAYRILLGRSLGKPRRKLEGDIKIYSGEIGCENRKWMELARDCVQ